MKDKLLGLLFLMPLLSFNLGGLWLMMKDWKDSTSQKQYVIALIIIISLAVGGVWVLAK